MIKNSSEYRPMRNRYFEECKTTKKCLSPKCPDQESYGKSIGEGNLQLQKNEFQLKRPKSLLFTPYFKITFKIKS
jgi:hypothetical protein